MAALERKPMRLNGLVDETTDKALFDALSGVLPRRRMALLRRLANLGLMVEQGRVATESHSVQVAAIAPPPVAAPKARPSAVRIDPSPPAISVVSEPKTVVSDCVVTTTAEKQPDPSASTNEKTQGRKLGLMGRMDVSIMD